MKFEVKKSILLAGLQTAYSAIPNKASLQILNNFLFRLEGNFLEITATDLDLGVRVRVEVTGQRDGAIALSARKILDLIKVLPDTIVSLSEDNYLMRISWGPKTNAKITGIEATDFPVIPELESPTSLNISRAELGFLIDKTMFAVSTDSTRLALNGVFVEQKDNRLMFVATDGHRLGKAFVEHDGLALEKGVIVPPKALSQILRATSPDAQVEININDTHIKFTSDGIQVVSKLIEGAYPKYENVIPQNFERQVQANRAELIDIVRHVMAIANQRTHQIRFQLEESNLELSATDTGIGGECRESLSVNHDFSKVGSQGSQFAIGYNGLYLSEVLSMCPTEEVVIKLNTPTGASVIEPLGEGLDFTFLLMPLRLIEE